VATGSEIAIVGMSGRFPGARNLEEFWENLRNGVESVRTFTDDELRAAGVSTEELTQPEYVKAGVVLQDLDMFDAAFFGFSPRDAAIMDPQHRLFLECAWEALENAGRTAANFPGSIGVYAGSGMNTYLIHNLLTNRALMDSAGLFLIRQTGNDKDVLATRVSYELNLHGPSINVQTACSTSLVAIHLACQSLLNQECDMALAGGVTIEFPHGHGYVYREGEILSRDGHCRSFDAESSGTVFSSGAGLVVLRRLEDALADQDTIHAIILGSAINNDGSRKAGYLAPSVDGQAEVIHEALGMAGVLPEDISYVETHGTGTKVGDPIEIKALTKAFRQGTQENAYCAIGALKASIGHLDTAAGVAGLIKTVLALEHRQIPATLHFRKANPLIDFANSPFYVNASLTDWRSDRGRRRAGVTSLGIGGTNAHVILEEAPATPANDSAGATKPYQLLVLSAKTTSALDQMTQNLGRYLESNPDTRLAEVAFTLQTGRKEFRYRRAIVADSTANAARVLLGSQMGPIFPGQALEKAAEVVFLFSGQGSQYVNMCRGLYDTEPVFRRHLDFCAGRLKADLALDLRSLIFTAEQDATSAAEQLSRTRYTQPALFSIEYALAQWWISLGVSPSAMMGHSIGEYVAACLAGVFSAEDGLHIAAVRGRLMDEMPRGSMLSVAASPDSLTIPPELSLAVINGPDQCVVAGAAFAVQQFEDVLQKSGVPCRQLHTSHAFHSAMMDPMLDAFRAEMAKIELRSPAIPYISNLSGTWISPDEAKDPSYWANHLRNAVQFSRGLEELFRDSSRFFLEVGPGQVLTSLTRQHPARPKTSKVFASVRHPQEQIHDAACIMGSAAQLWITGYPIRWTALFEGNTTQRIPLPTYPFERQRFWIEPGEVHFTAKKAPEAAAAAPRTHHGDSIFHHRVWKRAPLLETPSIKSTRWLLFVDELGLGSEIATQLEAAGHQVDQVSPGRQYAHLAAGKYTVRPGAPRDYTELLADLVRADRVPKKILHLWSVTDPDGASSLDSTLDFSFYSLLFLAQAVGDQDLAPIELTCISNGLLPVGDEPVFEPSRGALLGPVRVIPKEFSGTLCRHIDFDRKVSVFKDAVAQLLAECSAPFSSASCVALRNGERWIESIDSAPAPEHREGSRLKEKGVYWITGGLGGIGLLVAEHLARTKQGRLVLSGRTPLPPELEWDALLAKPQPTELQEKLKKLSELRTLGAEVLTLSVDVTDSKQVDDALRTIHTRFGALDGIIHAAGIIEDGPLQLKTRESAARVLAPKLQGTITLHKALRGSKLDFFLLFSSISSLDPPAGQVDYAAANAFLDAFAASQTDLPTIAVNWGLWTDVGMAAQSGALGHPLLSRRLFQSASESLYSLRVSCEKNWLLAEHRLKSGEALVPGTGYLQLAASALAPDTFEPGVTFEDVFFLAPFSVKPGETKEVRVRLRRQRSGYRFSIFASDKNDWIEYATGLVERNADTAPRQNLTEILNRCSSRSMQFDDTHRTRQERYFEFGPRWRNLRTMRFGNREAVSELQLNPDFRSDLNDFPLHPALLDLATGSALYLVKGYQSVDAVYLPLSYKRIRFFRSLCEKFYSHIRGHQENTTHREIVSFDFTLLDPAGHVLAEIDEFSLRRIAVQPNEPILALQTRTSTKSADYAGDPVREGLSVAEAIHAFDAVLSAKRLSNIIVARNAIPPESAAARISSPETKPVAKSGSVESVLAEWWQDLLGVEKVSPDDDFFDLGGHSLIAVRLFSKIKKEYRLDLGLSTLFEARTVRKLAELIRKTGPVTAPEEIASSPVVSIRQEGTRAPLFLISGLGGEVIGFDALARYLGRDQPVYALQPKGLDGRSSYLTRVEDMAEYYLAEVRNLQPHGPYCFAGYSFGGYVIYEMAQHLHAEGEPMGLLGFLDTIEWQYYEGLSNPKAFGDRWMLRFNRLKYRRWDYLRDTALSIADRVLSPVVHKLGWSLPEGMSALERINLLAMAQYRPRVYPGKLTIFRSVTRDAAMGMDELLGWGSLVSGGFEVHDVTGRHLEMLMEPNVRILAEKLRLCLDRVQDGQKHANSPDISLQPTSLRP